MGADIHWAVERRLKTGDWVVTHSQTLFFALSFDDLLSDPDRGLTSPEFLFGLRNYDYFSIMSDVRRDREPIRSGGQIAHPGLPEDASSFAWAMLNDNGDYHSQSWLTLGEFRAAIDETPFLFDAEEFRAILRQRLEMLEKILAGDPVIHFGRDYDFETEESLPDMLRNGHAKIAAQRQVRDLLPVGDDTVRVLFAYDN